MLATLQTQQLEATQLIRQLQLDVELRDKRIAALDHDVSAAQQFRDDRERQVEMLTADRATLAKDLHRANEDLVNLRRQLSRSENAATEHATSDRNAVAKAVEQVEQHLAAREHAWSEERDTFQRQLDEARANIQQQVDANMAQHQQATVDLRAELETARADLAAASDTATYHAHLKQENTALFQQINDLRAQFSATVEEKTKAVEQVERLQAINKRIIGELRAFEGYRGEVEQLKEIIRQQTPIVSPTSVSTGTDARGDADDDEEVTGEAERRLLHEHDARHVQQPTIDTDALLETLEEERNRSLKLEEELAALKRELAERVNTTAITDNAENNTATSVETVESEPSSPTIKDYITLEQHLDLVMADRDSFGTRLEEAAAANRALKQRLARAEHLSAQLQMESETVPL